MKIGIIADIHGRYRALRSVINKLSKTDAIINLGDVADYSPDINDCYALLQSEQIHNLLGNHEQEVLETSDDELLLLDDNGLPLAEDFGVNDLNKQFIRNKFTFTLNLTKNTIGYNFSHGPIIRNQSRVVFDYLTPMNFLKYREKHRADICFCGHIHRHQIIVYINDDLFRADDIKETTIFHIENDKTYGFNVGMLSPIANNSDYLQYALIDTIANTVELIITN